MFNFNYCEIYILCKFFPVLTLSFLRYFIKQFLIGSY